MDLLTRSTLRNGAVAGAVGTILGFVPLVMLVAPLLGGGVAGVLERDGVRRGAIAGAVAGLVMAILSTAVSTALLFVRFGELSGWGFRGGIGPFALAGTLSLLSAIGVVVFAGIGGGLGGLLISTQAHDGSGRPAEPASPSEGSRFRLAGFILGSLVAGGVTFGLVALALTAALNPFIWPSALVGLPLGFIAGSAIAVLSYAYLSRQSETKRNWRRIGGSALVIAMAFSVVVAGLFVLGGDRIDESTESSYNYEVAIATNGTLHDATLYVPVPVVNGTSEIGELFVNEVQYHRSAPVVRGYDSDPEPIEFTYELIETEHGPMLAISTDRIEVTQVYYRTVENETMGWHERIDPAEYDPTNPMMGVQDDGSFTFSVSLAVNRSIDTIDPFGTEPLFATSELLMVDCRDGASESERCFEYDSHGYAAYESHPETTVYVRAGFEARNEWFSGGWSGNEYLQSSSIELVGPQSGWHVTTGTLDVGRGNYR